MDYDGEGFDGEGYDEDLEGMDEDYEPGPEFDDDIDEAIDEAMDEAMSETVEDAIEEEAEYLNDMAARESYGSEDYESPDEAIPEGIEFPEGVEEQIHPGPENLSEIPTDEEIMAEVMKELEEAEEEKRIDEIARKDLGLGKGDWYE